MTSFEQIISSAFADNERVDTIKTLDTLSTRYRYSGSIRDLYIDLGYPVESLLGRRALPSAVKQGVSTTLAHNWSENIG